MATAAVDRDFQRSKVYAAERALLWLHDRGGDGATAINGVPLQLEPEARFADLASVQRYIDRVTRMPAVIARFGTSGTVTVRERKGSRAAHYRDGVIALHTTGSNSERWSLRELTANHELAHHYTRDCGAGHGPEFTAAFADLVEIVIGPQTALALRLLYAAEGVH